MRNAHPREEKLALYQGGELGWFDRLRTAAHVTRCGECRHQVSSFEAVSAYLQRAGQELPSAAELGRDWDGLAAQMAANIRVGLEAAACLDDQRRRPVAAAAQHPAWQMLAACTATLLVAAGVLWTRNGNAPAPGSKLAAHGGATSITVPVKRAGIVLTATPAGISLQEGDAALTLLGERRAKREAGLYFTSSPDSLRVRYLDAETGQVTINHVYAE